MVVALTALGAALDRRGVRGEMYVGVLAGDDPAAAPVLDVPGLRCLAASAPMLLALKVLAHRVGEDESDTRLLAGELGLTTAQEVLAVAEEVFGDRLEPAARFFVEELFAGAPPEPT